MTLKGVANWYGTGVSFVGIALLMFGLVTVVTEPEPGTLSPAQIAAERTERAQMFETMEYTRVGQASVLASTCKPGDVVVLALGAPDAEIVKFDEAYRQAKNGMSFVLDKCEA